MSELRIDPDLGADIDWTVGEEYTFPVTATVTAKTKDGGYTMEVSDVQPESDVEDASAGDMREAEVGMMPPKRKGPSAVNMMIGK